MTGATFRDFEIQILTPDRDGDGAGNRVTAEVSPTARRARGRFVSPFQAGHPDERLRNVETVLRAIEEETLDRAYAKAVGAALFEALFADELGRLYEACREADESPMRFRLVIDSPALRRLPWELMYDAARETFLSLEGPFVRDAALVEAAEPLTVYRPLRVLVVDTAPSDLALVGGRVEVERIRESLSGLGGDLRLEVLTHATPGRLQAALIEAQDRWGGDDGPPFHVIHFIGHGTADGEGGGPALLFENENGVSVEVGPDGLVDLLRGSVPGIVFLNACEVLQGDLAEGFAPALMALGVPAVIGMQAALRDQLAVQISHDFYRSLTRGVPVDEALSLARRVALGPAESRGADLAVAACYLRAPDGRVFEVAQREDVPLTLSTALPWLGQQVAPRRLPRTLMAVAGFVAVLLGLYWGLTPFFERQPPMRGDINVAVAPFEARAAEGSQARAGGDEALQLEGVALAQSVADELTEELAKLSENLADGGGGFLIEVRGPDRLERITGRTPDERWRVAEALAEEVNAHVVLYGGLEVGDRQSTLHPEMYIAERQLLEAVELAGHYRLGSEIGVLGDIGSLPQARRNMREALLGRMGALEHFIIGLGYHALDDFETAQAYFTQAAAIPGWDDRDGREVLYHFQGETARQTGEYESARKHYAAALALNPEYTRSLLGMSEATFQAARGECTAGTIGEERLRSALAGLSLVDGATADPSDDSKLKAAFVRGRILLCQGQAGDNEALVEAERELESVVADVESMGSPSRRLSILAGEALASLGYLRLPSAGQSDAQADYEAAADDLEAAVALLEAADPWNALGNQAAVHALLGFVHGRLGDSGRAARAYDEAIRLDPESAGRYEALKAALE